MVQKKDFVSAILLNLFLPGAGYIYVGRVFLGGVVLALAFGPLFWALSSLPVIPDAVSGWIGMLAIIGAIDGYLTVKRHNDREDAISRTVEESLRAMLKKCPHCAESIQPEARVCRYCGRDVI